MDDGPIELNRQFVEAHEGKSALDVEARLQVAHHFGHCLSWDALLESSYIVVLGEAGTGKSTEFERQPQVLRSKGTCAFFMDITRLARDGPCLAVEVGTASELKVWRGVDEEGVFFLDSVDEAQLRQHSLAEALSQLRAFMGEAAKRARLVISCRVSDWDAESGTRDLERFAEAAKSDERPKIVHFMPLDDVRVERLARHHGCEDPKALLDAVCHASAQPFVARPLDVEWLVRYWNEHKKIGTLTQLVERSVEMRLDERRPNSCPPSTLPKDKAQEGLERLAGIAVLSGRWSFLILGAKSSGAQDLDTLDPREVLGDWSVAEIRELLTRAVFDESTYGRLRLHHRVVQEYLAATWLQKKVEEGLTRTALERLLVREVGGRSFIPAHLAATVAWFALLDEPVCKRVIDVEPELLFQYGDPESLASDVRVAALDAYLQRYEQVQNLYERFDRDALRRFAPVLADTILERLERGGLPDEAVTFLLKMACEGDLRSCASEAIRWAADTRADPHLRCEAFRAAAQLGDPSAQRELATTVLAQPGPWDQNAAGVFASRFFPAVLSVDEVGKLLCRIAPGAPNSHTVIKSFVSYDVPRTCPVAQRLDMLRELVRATRATEHDKGWLLSGVQKLAGLIVENLDRDEEPPSAIQEAILFVRSNEVSRRTRSIISLDELETAISANSRVRRWLFWTRVEEVKGEGAAWPEGPPYRAEALSEVGEDDVDWLADDALRLDERGARTLAFNTLRQLRREHAHVQEVLDRVATESPNSDFSKSLRADEEARNASNELTEWERVARERQEAREREAAELHRKELEVLRREIDAIRSGEQRYVLQHLGQRCGGDASRYGIVDLDRLRGEYGADIADAAIEGWKACWRSVRPPFQFEEANRAETSGDVMVGLVGLFVDFAEGLDPAELDDTDVEHATRYAARELNEFPEWFSRLAAAHTDAAAAALQPAIDADLRLDPDAHPEVLGKWRSLPDTLRQPVARVVLNALESADPANASVLEDALIICQWLDGEDVDRLFQISVNRYETAESIELGVQWWCSVARIDPLCAVCGLEEFCAGASEDDGKEVMIATCEALEFSFDESPPVPQLLNHVEALERMIPLVYAKVRKGDDKKNTSGRARWVSPRMEAERFRDSSFASLSSIGTAEAFAALTRLAEDPRMSEHRDVLLLRARQSPQRSVAALPMTPAEAIEWNKHHAVPIRTRHDLFRVVLDRLKDAALKIEEGEFSQRERFHALSEDAFQMYLAEKLDSSRDVHGYVISREVEVDRKKKPDIRISHSECAGRPVTIEIKVAESWTVPELREALRVQLVGQYLRAARSRYGIFLLCSRPRKKTTRKAPRRKRWRLNGESLDFYDVVQLLRDEARDLVASRDDVDGLEVVTIDFH